MSLMLHCGAQAIDRPALAAVPTPPPMGPRHKPVPYADFVDLASDALNHVGLRVTDEKFGTLADGSRFFGLMEVAPIAAPANDRDFGLMVGLRASHDQSFARGLVVGSRVFVCDNLAFSGEVSVNTKQTLHIEDRLPAMVYQAVESLPQQFAIQDARFDAYKARQFKSRWGDAALVEMIRRKVLTGSSMARALTEWDTPTYEEHAEGGHTLWRLMQSVTEALKVPVDEETGYPNRPAAPMAMERTVRMTRFLDELAGFDVVQAHGLKREAA